MEEWAGAPSEVMARTGCLEHSTFVLFLEPFGRPRPCFGGGSGADPDCSRETDGAGGHKKTNLRGDGAIVFSGGAARQTDEWREGQHSFDQIPPAFGNILS